VFRRVDREGILSCWKDSLAPVDFVLQAKLPPKIGALGVRHTRDLPSSKHKQQEQLQGNETSSRSHRKSPYSWSFRSILPASKNGSRDGRNLAQVRDGPQWMAGGIFIPGHVIEKKDSTRTGHSAHGSRGPHDIVTAIQGSRLVERPTPTPNSRSFGRGTVQLGTFDVDLRGGELRKGGVKVRLYGQPFSVLAALLERPGQVVTREELQQKLWAGDTFVDFEHGLNKAINKVRDALGD